MSRTHQYHARVTWSGASAGPTRSYESYSRAWTAAIEGKAPLAGSADPTFRGDAKLHNPEDLLLVALSTCHMLSYLALAAMAKLTVLAYEDAPEATMTLERGGGRFSDVLLRPRVTVAAGSDQALAEQLHANAHEVCFIASSVNFPVRHEATIVEAGA
jgi:organic hydroperoxide reductase OsmC/OhrA